MFEIHTLGIPKEWFGVPESIEGDPGRSHKVA
jgi:hypothetical protein